MNKKTKKQEYFAVTYVCRDDVEQAMIDSGNKDLVERVKDLTNNDMQWIAEQMGDSYTESGDFWEAVKEFSEDALRRPTSYYNVL